MSTLEIERPESRLNAPAGYAVYAEALVRQFGGVRAVDGVDLRIRAGEIYGFLGPNGAGKSTTVRMLCTLLAPTGGRALVAGHDVAAEPGRVRLRIGVALQDAALDPKQTGTELLRLQGRLYGLSRRALARRLAELGELIDLGDALDRPIGTYSGGMKRRLDLAAALVHNPEVLFLDEPTTGLDPVSRARVWDEVRRLNEQLGMTIFLTTQYLEEADELAAPGRHHRPRPHRRRGHPGRAEAVGRLRRHRRPRRRRRRRRAARRRGSPRRAKRRGARQRAASSPPATARRPSARVAVALAGSAVPVRDLTLRTPTLDDVFLELTGSPHRTHERNEEEPRHDCPHRHHRPARLPSR